MSPIVRTASAERRRARVPFRELRLSVVHRNPARVGHLPAPDVVLQAGDDVILLADLAGVARFERLALGPAGRARET